jgi:hypothetical protein
MILISSSRFQNNLSYKNFTLGISFDGRIAANILDYESIKCGGVEHIRELFNQFRDDANEGKSTYIADGVVGVEGNVTYDEDGKILTGHAHICA